MNKKGFTLVELLAVIAILAILVILALPNILNLFNDAKKSAFKTEVQTLYNTAQQQYILDGGKAVQFYKNKTTCSNTAYKTLSLKGTNTFYYYINITAQGKITELYAHDGTYSFYYSGSDLKVEQIGEGTNNVKLLTETSSTDNAQTLINGKCSS